MCLELNEYIKNDRVTKTFVTASVGLFSLIKQIIWIWFGQVTTRRMLYAADKDAVLDLKNTGLPLGMNQYQKRLNAFMKESPRQLVKGRRLPA